MVYIHWVFIAYLCESQLSVVIYNVQYHIEWETQILTENRLTYDMAYTI